MSSIFRLKFTYKYEDKKTGEIKKTKTEIFAECETYTEAETMVYAIVEHNNWDEFGPFEYEIIKTKYTTGDFIDHDTLTNDGLDSTLEGKVENYFSEDNDGFFILKVKFIYLDDKGNEKSNTKVYIVTDHSIGQAIISLKNYLNRSQMLEYAITDSKLDPADCIYLCPDSYESIRSKYEA